MTERNSWRDVIKVHPAADMFPMMSDEELRALAADIDEHGLQHGLVFYYDGDFYKNTKKQKREIENLNPEFVVLLDGRNRIEAVERFSKKYKLFSESDDDSDKVILYSGSMNAGTGETKILDSYYTCDDPYAYVISANAHRRHLTAQQKRELIVELLKARPERSDRATAAIVKADHKTVGAVRAALVDGGEIPRHAERVGADGVTQPVKPPKVEPDEEPPMSGAELEAMEADRQRNMGGLENQSCPTTPWQRSIAGKLDFNDAAPQVEPEPEVCDRRFNDLPRRIGWALKQINGVGHVATITTEIETLKTRPSELTDVALDAFIKHAKSGIAVLRNFVRAAEDIQKL